MVICGWCGHSTKGDPCASCGHEDPGRPWRQRGQEPPRAPDGTGRQPLDRRAVIARLNAAKRALTEAGKPLTVDALAEQLDISPRTVRRWREMAS